MKINAFLDKNRFTNIKQKKERKKERESSDSTNKESEKGKKMCFLESYKTQIYQLEKRIIYSFK
jgi:hypothetical protein